MKRLVILFVFTFPILLFSCKPVQNDGDEINLLENATEFTGEFPNTTTVSYCDEGTDIEVEAFEGQIILFFQGEVNNDEATEIITNSGGEIIEKVPSVGYYLAEVEPSEAGTILENLQENSLIETAMPNIVGYLKSGATILDYCGTKHGEDVQKVFLSCGGTFDECLDILLNDSIGKKDTLASLSKTIRNIVDVANKNKTKTTLINLSANGGLKTNTDYSTVSAQLQAEGKYGWYKFMLGVLMTVAALPDEFRENLVITISAGNENMPIDDILSTLRDRDRIADVLHSNVLIVTTDISSPVGNYALNDEDVVVMNNDSSYYGTSLAAPCALGMIQTVMDEKKVGAKEALMLVKQASINNPQRELLWSDLLPMTTYSTGKSTLMLGPYSFKYGPYTCYQDIYFYVQPVMYWKNGKGTLIMPVKYERKLTADSNSGCKLRGEVKDSTTYQIILSGSDSKFQGVGRQFLKSGEQPTVGENGFYCPVVFWGSISNGTVNGTLKLSVENGESVITNLTLSKQ